MKSRVELQLSKGRSCVYCGKQNNTTVPHHYKGMYQELFRNRSKVHDLMTMDLCFTCHNDMHNNSHFNKQSKEEQTLLQYRLIQQTLKRDHQNGNLIDNTIIFNTIVNTDMVDSKWLLQYNMYFKSLIKQWELGNIKYIK